MALQVLTNQDAYIGPIIADAPSLVDIPEELLLYIVSHVMSDDGSLDTATLMALSTVSRQFQRIATPLAYEAFDTRKHKSVSVFTHLVGTP